MLLTAMVLLKGANGGKQPRVSPTNAPAWPIKLGFGQLQGFGDLPPRRDRPRKRFKDVDTPFILALTLDWLGRPGSADRRSRLLQCVLAGFGAALCQGVRVALYSMPLSDHTSLTNDCAGDGPAPRAHTALPMRRTDKCAGGRRRHYYCYYWFLVLLWVLLSLSTITAIIIITVIIIIILPPAAECSTASPCGRRLPKAAHPRGARDALRGRRGRGPHLARTPPQK